jgi:spiro-SPASM protein
METLTIINATQVNEYATRPFSGGPSAFDRVLRLGRSIAPEGGLMVLAGTAGFADPGCPVVRKDSWTMHSVLAECAAFASSHPTAAAVLYLQADAPFTDAALTATLLGLHGKYRAEYTFADGYPPGFAPEVLAARSLPNLVELSGRHDAPADRDGVFAVIQKDINSYDIETHLSPVDLRSYRFAPVCDTRRDTLAAERLWALGARSAVDVTKLLPKHQELLRTVPAFLWVQIAAACPQACSYCPYPAMVGDPTKLDAVMPVSRFEALMAEAHGLCDDLVVDVSLWGEPSRHPDFRALAEAVMARPRFTLIVETSGIGWTAGLAEALAARWGERIQWIVSLDDADPAGYLALRGDGQDEAIAFAERMLRAATGRVHIQAVRMKDNEGGLEAFYRGWKKLGDKVIIQKYDSFAGCLPDKSVADLSPLGRYPCRHLARDIAVLLDGSVPTCKHSLVSTGVAYKPGVPGECFRYAEIVGNVFDDGFKAVWDRTGSWYGRHLSEDYPEPCGRCDEYHTFNA